VQLVVFRGLDMKRDLDAAVPRASRHPLWVSFRRIFIRLQFDFGIVDNVR